MHRPCFASGWRGRRSPTTPTSTSRYPATTVRAGRLADRRRGEDAGDDRRSDEQARHDRRRRVAQRAVPGDDVGAEQAARDHDPQPRVGGHRRDCRRCARSRRGSPRGSRTRGPSATRPAAAPRRLRAAASRARPRPTTAASRRGSSSRPGPSPRRSAGRSAPGPRGAPPARPTWSSPRRSESSGTAMNATQMNIVLWMNAAVGAVAIARPLKNSTNGTLPPITAIASTPRRGRGREGRGLVPRTEQERDRHEDDGRDRVLGGRVDGGVRDELHAERVEIDRQPADGGRREREQHATLRAVDSGTVHDAHSFGEPLGSVHQLRSARSLRPRPAPPGRGRPRPAPSRRPRRQARAPARRVEARRRDRPAPSRRRPRARGPGTVTHIGAPPQEHADRGRPVTTRHPASARPASSTTAASRGSWRARSRAGPSPSP